MASARTDQMVFLIFMDTMMDQSGGDMQPNFGQKMHISPHAGKEMNENGCGPLSGSVN
jgi:hypothetical protein